MASKNALADIIHAVSDDPEVKSAARALALEAIDQASFLLNHGSPAVKSAMLKSILPTAFAGMREAVTDANAAESRAQMEAILAEMRST